MAGSLGQQLLRRLRRHRDRLAAPPDAHDDQLPDPPAAQRLRQAAEIAVSGRSDDRDELARLLLAIDRASEPGMLAEAEQVLLRAEPRLWLALDIATRRSWWHAPGWSSAATERVATGTPSLVGLVVASFHPDGYVREAAVARLAEFNEPLAAAPLALRAADWVPQVRDRARLALERRLADSLGATLVTAAPITLACKNASRAVGWRSTSTRSCGRGPPWCCRRP